MTVDNKAESNEKVPSYVNSLEMLNVMHGEGPAKKMLMHVHVVVNGARVKAMMNSGATHNLVAAKETSGLRLRLEEDTSWTKVVNNKVQDPMHSQRCHIAS